MFNLILLSVFKTVYTEIFELKYMSLNCKDSTDSYKEEIRFRFTCELFRMGNCPINFAEHGILFPIANI